MARLSTVTWIAEEQIASQVRLEPVLVLVVLACAAWVAYKLFLRGTSNERHKIFRAHFRNLWLHLSIFLILFGIYELVDWTAVRMTWSSLALPYIGFFTVVGGAVVLVKILRIIAYEYLFLSSRKAGVPLLLVNIFTLVLSLIMGGWILTKFFEVDLTPLLATSAILSIVLGLALQDTLGNLFAAIALQIDKPFELGDWIEVKSGQDKVAGQVLEVTWRATVLLAITEEFITIPNRNMAQSQISNFAARERSFIRSHVFRIPFGSDVEAAKAALVSAAVSIQGILKDPGPVVIITETTDSWVTMKVIYNISDYGAQFGITDRYLTKALNTLRQQGIELAANRLSIESQTSAS